MTYENVAVRRENGVAYLTMEGANALNALDDATTDGLMAAVTDAVEDDNVRCLVLTGAGDAFGAGADLARFDGDASDAPELRRLASALHDVVLQLHQAPKPVVTAVNGVAAGAGFSLALVGDVVLVSEDAALSYAYPRVGLTGDGGSTFFLPRLVGLRTAKEIALLDGDLTPEEAVDLNVATEAVPADDFDDRVTELAERLADGPTKAFGATKRLMTESFERSLPEQLAAETEAMADATHTEDYARGHAAFFEKSDPDFVGK
ncbi:enoyl-CoA hydratase/isomerase family protein [Salarchaeum sp. JOR-1]|uniref:enoyl-CoA hydratase/isomerase family protein n=1 Tax=Salarchaeum sp. JOR-1 TaxID=2599399 RepID=UPI00119887E6|nr:enoyl-CoA hydratase-related protein [Salarchaeum sp. JOR-1]QDX41137.1 enoyl-CoA hydratase/isomerase family protein [Salarchaeum sp. JOR-1]